MWNNVVPSTKLATSGDRQKSPDRLQRQIAEVIGLDDIPVDVTELEGLPLLL
jgi:hypothetical protein